MLKMIIIDDEAIIRESLNHFIDWKSIDIEVVGLACNGSDAVSLILQVTPDIILSDINMPVLTGIELIKLLRQRQIKSEVIFISAYNDFEYARAAIHHQAFDYILKPIDEELLFETVKKCAQQILLNQEKNRLLTSVHYNKTIKTTELLERLLCDYNFKATKAEEVFLTEEKIFSAGYQSYMAAGLWGAPPDEAISQQIQKLFSEYLEDSFLLEIPHEDNLHVLIVLSSNSSPASLQESFYRIMDALPDTECITLSNPYPFSNDFKNLFTEIVLSYKTKDLFPPACVYTYSSLQSKSRHWGSHDFKKMFADLLAENDNTTLSTVIPGLFMQFINDNIIYDLNLVKLQCIEFIDTFINQMKELQLQNYLYSNSLSSKKNITAQNSIDGIYDVTLHMFSNLFSCIETIWQKSASQFVRSTLEYIHDNYGKNISLTTLAGELYISPAYLSKIFSAEMKQPFSKYILNYRIERSKELLKTPQYKIYDIAQTCGFFDVAHFSKTFKLFVGVSPHKYRNSPLK